MSALPRIVTFDAQAALRILLSRGAAPDAARRLVADAAEVLGRVGGEQAPSGQLRLDTERAASRLEATGYARAEAESLVAGVFETIEALNPAAPSPAPDTPVFVMLSLEEAWALVRDFAGPTPCPEAGPGVEPWGLAPDFALLAADSKAVTGAEPGLIRARAKIVSALSRASAGDSPDREGG